MKRLKLILLIVLLATAYSANSQKLTIKRTDVDSTRAHFVTAKYIFGVDIYAEDVENSNGVSFELRYDQIDYIKFSEYKIGNFGPKGELHIKSLINEQTGEGRVIVGAGTGNPLGPGGISNPKIVHLEFAVLQNVPYNELEPHYDMVTFYFVNPKATIFIDSIPQSIELETEPFSFDMHGYINVWPGDSDNNGIVNSDDYNRVLFYLGLGANTKNMRSFKRPMASSLWVPQKVLAWDSSAATYADSDGNGSITMADMLIVDHNIDKNHSKIDKSAETPALLSEENYFGPEYTRIPVRVNSSQNYHAASATITWSNFFGKVVGIEKGDAFKSDKSRILYKIRQSENMAELSVVTGKSDINQSDNATLAWLVIDLEEGSSPPSVNISHAYGIGEMGSIFPLSAISSIEDEKCNGDLSIDINNSNIEIYSNEMLLALKIYDIQGRLVYSIDNIQSNNLNIPSNILGTGLFIASASTKNRIYNKRIVIIR